MRRFRWTLVAVALLSTPMSTVPAEAAVSVDSRVQVRFSGLVLNRATNTFDTVATITNVSQQPLAGPLSVVITSITAAGVTLLLQKAERASWARALMVALAEPGEGTLEHRLHGVNVHAKTGTLEDISALSGWVWLSRLKTWAEFSNWLESLDENGIQISLKLPCLVYQAVKKQQPSMQNFIVEAVKKSLKESR